MTTEVIISLACHPEAPKERRVVGPAGFGHG